MSNNAKKIYVALTLPLLLIVSCQSSQDKQARVALQEIAKSHIESNVPEDAEFNKLLQRDLDGYFIKKYSKSVNVSWEFLREGPTQTGIAYPKYYVWVTVLDRGKELAQGAVRLAAIEKKRFEVTHFVDVGDMKGGKTDIHSIFPAPVCETIAKRLQ